MDVRVLGAVEVRIDGRARPIRGMACRAALAMLALHERGTSVDEFVDGLWLEDFPRDPEAALQVTISRLRRSLGARDLIVRRGRAYVLEIDREAVDLHRADVALREGRRAADAGDLPTAVRRLGDGLAEWRGQPLLEFADLPFASVASSRIHLLHLDLSEARNAALLASGRPAVLIDDTEEILAGDPWREDLTAQLMLALYRCGRPLDALAAYARLASALRRDFQVEPSPDLRNLRERISRRDPDLQPDKAGTVPEKVSAALPHWFAEAIDVDAETDPRVRSRLLVALGEVQHHAGQPEWRETLVQAADLATRIGDVDALARAALAGDVGWNLQPGHTHSRRLELLESALGAADELDDATRARLLAARATERTFDAAIEERVRDSDEAIQAARRSGQAGTLLAVLTHRFNAVWSPDTLDDRERHLAEAAALADAQKQPIARALTCGWQMAAAMERGQLREADAHLARFGALAESLDLPFLRWGCVLHGAWRAVVDGELDQAEALSLEARAVGLRAERPEAAVVATMQRLGIRWAQGRLGEEVGTVVELTAAMPGFVVLRAVHALALTEAGELGAARGIVSASCRDSDLDVLPRNQVYLAALVHWAEAVHALGDESRARAVSSRLAPYAAQFVFTGGSVYGPVAQTLGLLASSVGDTVGATRHFTDALAMSSAMPAPFFIERSRTFSVSA